jgi:hypothetical protein
MAIAFGSISAATADGTTSLSVAYPSGISAGDLLLLCVVNKWVAFPTSPGSPWTSVHSDSAGAGANSGSDSGTCVATMWQTVATGSESGSVSVTITSGNSAQGFIVRVTRSAGSGWDLAATTARWTTDNTNPISVTFDDDVGITAGDYLGLLVGLNANAPTNLSSETLTATSATIGARSQRRFTATGTGGDCIICYSDGTVTSGTATAAPAVTITKNTSALGEGPLILIRAREATSGGFVPAWARNANQMIQRAHHQ